MSLTTYHQGQEGDECQCGRRASVAHCTRCGSFRLYGYAEGEKVIRQGQLVTVGRYRCTTCGNRFTDVDREFCTAPVFTKKIELVKMQVKRMKQAVIDGHPLTDKEELIRAGIQSLEGIEITREQDTKWRVEWGYSPRLRQEFATPDEYIHHKVSMIKAGKKESEQVSGGNDVNPQA